MLTLLLKTLLRDIMGWRKNFVFDAISAIIRVNEVIPAMHITKCVENFY